MKIFLRLLGKVRLKRKLSAVGNKQSAESCRPSALHRHSPSQYRLSPKTYTRIALLLFILVFVSCSAALAQDVDVHSTPAAQAEIEITPLKIGDRIPDELWEMYFPVVSANSDQVQYLSLGDFKDKLIILDFWATWCGSCYKGLTSLNQWEKDFREDLLFVPISYQESEEIKKVLINKEWDFSSIFDDEVLKEYFPHRGIPHQIIISNEKILAITSGTELTKDDISSLIKDEVIDFRIKDEIMDFDKNALLLKNDDDRFKEQLFYSSSFFTHIDGLVSSSGFSKDSHSERLYFTNKRIIDFYFTVISPLILNRVFFEVKNLSRINYDVADRSFDREGWLLHNTYSYELIAPRNTSKDELYELALQDFDRQFGLESELVEREVECYVITNHEGKRFIDPFKGQQPDENQVFLPFEKLLEYLNTQLSNEPQRPIFINESNTEMSNPILITKGKYRDVGDLQKILASYGLEVKKAKRDLQVFVIKDKIK